MNLDLYLFRLINGLAGHCAGNIFCLDSLGIFFAEYLEYFLWATLLILLILNYKKYWKMVLEAVIAALFTRFVLVEFIRFIWFRARPFVNNHVNLLIPYNAHEPSFPSGHASFYFALSTIVYFYNKKAGTFFYLVTILIVTGRIFVGIHWPSDVLAGAIIGILMGWGLNKLFRKHGHKIIKNYNKT